LGAHWDTKGISDWVTVSDRNARGCCPQGYVPGTKAIRWYHSSQVVCGFEANGDLDHDYPSSSGNPKTCNYNKCFVFHQDLTCSDKSKQRLNGCCGPSGARTFRTDCNKTHDSVTSTPTAGDDVSVSYCATRELSMDVIGTQGGGDDLTPLTGRQRLGMCKFWAWAPCPTSLADGCERKMKFDSEEQGAPFNRCILRQDFYDKTLDDYVVVIPREKKNDCCPQGYVPGAKMHALYHGAQIVCGFTYPSGSLMGGYEDNTATADGGKCNYGSCYVFKQGLTCSSNTAAGDNQQKLNGCCGSHARPMFKSDCRSYNYTLEAAQHSHGTTYHNHGNTQYCLTYNVDYKQNGYHGTRESTDDVEGQHLNVCNFFAYQHCGSARYTCSYATTSTTNQNWAAPLSTDSDTDPVVDGDVAKAVHVATSMVPLIVSGLSLIF